MIVIGTSSGGLKAMFTLLAGLPENFPFPVAVVMHRHKETDDSLQAALQRHCVLPVSEAMDKEMIQPGHVYIAPPIIICWWNQRTLACRSTNLFYMRARPLMCCLNRPPRFSVKRLSA
jgi:chemotaxis response regulator CheB